MLFMLYGFKNLLSFYPEPNRLYAWTDHKTEPASPLHRHIKEVGNEKKQYKERVRGNMLPQKGKKDIDFVHNKEHLDREHASVKRGSIVDVTVMRKTSTKQSASTVEMDEITGVPGNKTNSMNNELDEETEMDAEEKVDSVDAVLDEDSDSEEIEEREMVPTDFEAKRVALLEKFSERSSLSTESKLDKENSKDSGISHVLQSNIVDVIHITDQPGYVLGKGIPNEPQPKTSEEIQRIKFYPQSTPQNKTIDFLFSLGVLDKAQMLTLPMYDHSKALTKWRLKRQNGKGFSALIPQLLEPTNIGQGTPNPYLPWHVPPCEGFPADPPFKPQLLTARSLPSHSSYIIKSLNEMGIYYYLDAGTLLGSYRHRGWIQGDKDMDIVIPVRRNLHLIGANYTCQGLEKGSKELPWTEHVRQTKRLCGRKVSQWAEDVFYPIMSMYFESTGVNLRLRHDTKIAPMKLWTHCLGERFNFASLPKSIKLKRACHYLDADIFLDFNPPAGDGVCTCPWYGMHALCPLDSTTVLKNSFGQDFMTPDRDLNDEGQFKKKEAEFIYEEVRATKLSEYWQGVQRKAQEKQRKTQEARHRNAARAYAKYALVKRRNRREAGLTLFRNVSNTNIDVFKTSSSSRKRRMSSDAVPFAQYAPALTFSDAQKAYKEMGVVFSWMDTTQPNANLRWHLDRLAAVKKRARAMRLATRKAEKDKLSVLRQHDMLTSSSMGEKKSGRA
eukprot:CFRG0905T1